MFCYSYSIRSKSFCIDSTSSSSFLTCFSLSPSSFSFFCTFYLFDSSFSSNFLTSSCFLREWCKLRFRAPSRSRTETWGKLSKSSTSGRSVGSTLSIQFITRINSSEYLSSIRLNLPSFILRASETGLLAINGGLNCAISYKMTPKDHISLFSLYSWPPHYSGLI